MEWMFASVLWSTVALGAWTVAVLMFCYAFVDLARREYRGWSRVGWVGLFVILPIAGPLAYVALTALRRCREDQSELRRITLGGPLASRPEVGRMTPAQLAVLRQQ